MDLYISVTKFKGEIGYSLVQSEESTIENNEGVDGSAWVEGI